MKKLILSITFILGLTFIVNAQTEGAVNKISLGGDFLYPTTGLLKDSYNLGYGASLEGEYNVLKNLNITLSAGYLSMAYKQQVIDANPGEPKTNSYFPAKLGVKYYFNNFYAAASSGVAVSLSDNINSAFIYEGGIGRAFSVSPKSNIDFGLAFKGWTSYISSINTKPSTSSFVGLRAAYSFGF